MSFFDGFGKIRYYVMIMAVLFVGYVWATFTGTKVTGDDNQAREEEKERRGGGRNFYHK